MVIRTSRLLPLVLALAGAPVFAAPDEYAMRRDLEALESVLVHVEHKQCAGAVKALNAGLAEKHPSVILLAGSMFEQGLCVRQDWDKAAGFYQLAHAAGKHEALPRLISGYAEKNRDPGAALWWMARQGWMPARCSAASHLADDPDAFVAELNTWPKGQVAACVYTAGVAMRIVGDVEFPGRGGQQGVFGDVRMHFVPSTGMVTWTPKGTDRVSVSRQAQVGEDQRSVFADVFLKHLRTVSDRALKQFARPEGIDPAWTVDRVFSFRYAY
jgi:hypothetical protein